MTQTARRLAIAALLLAAACGRGGDAARPPAPFVDGAQPLELPSLARGAKPTREEVEAVIARAVDVAGGAARLRKLSWKRIEDLWLSHTGTLDGNRVVATTLVRPDESVRVQLAYRAGEFEGRSMVRREEWLQPRAGKWALATGAAQQYVEWDWELVRLPVNLLDAERIEPLPPRVEEGVALLGAAITLPGLNPPFEVWIDPRGPVLAEVRTRLPITADFGVKPWGDHRQRFSDWRRVNGVLMPFRREIFVEGRRSGVGEAQTIEVDCEIKDAELMPQ